MSLLQEMESHGLADCEFNRMLIEIDEVSLRLLFNDYLTCESKGVSDEVKLTLIENELILRGMVC